jgi:ADP-heptose:LPS heptosyltransferase
MKILIYTSGGLGDILVLLPIFAAIRIKYNSAHIVLMNKHMPKYSGSPIELVKKAGYVDEVKHLKKWKFKLINICTFFSFPRRPAYDLVFYMVRDGKSLAGKIKKDLPFFKALSKGPVYGAVDSDDAVRNSGLRVMEMLLARINRGNPDPLVPNFIGLNFSIAEQDAAKTLYQQFHFPDGAIPFIICVGGKQEVCHWPLEKYRELLLRVIASGRAVPVFVGGKFDRPDIEYLIASLPVNQAFYAEKLQSDLWETICFMSLFPFYLGNDTGSIHMAAAAGIRCIGICSSHDPRGMWVPNGDGHTILRTDPDCAGCRKSKCRTFPAPCIDEVSVDMVYDAVTTMLDTLKNRTTQAI